MVKQRFVIVSLSGAVLLVALVAFPTTREAAENTVRAEKPVLIPAIITLTQQFNDNTFSKTGRRGH